MAAHGAIPAFDFEVFADTRHEPRHTTTLDPHSGEVIGGGVYGWLDWLEARKACPIYRTSAGSLAGKALELRTSKKSGRTYMKGHVPAYIEENGLKTGLLARTCTIDFKVRAIQGFLRTELLKTEYKRWRKDHAKALRVWKDYLLAQRDWKAADKHAKLMCLPRPNIPVFPRAEWEEMQADAVVEMAIGISIDEADRIKESREPWIRNVHPLIDLRMTRDDCKNWMLSHGYPIPPRSACTFCPFHSDEEWSNLKESPIDFAEAVQFDADLRAAAAKQNALKGTPYLHASLVPLDQVDFAANVTPGHAQLDLFRNECEGLCGV